MIVRLSCVTAVVMVLFVSCQSNPYGWEKVERRDFVFYCPKEWMDSTLVGIDTTSNRADVGFSFTAEKVLERLPEADAEGVILPMKKIENHGITMIVYEQPRYSMSDCLNRYDSCYAAKTEREFSDMKFTDVDPVPHNALQAYQLNIRPLMRIYHDVYHVFLVGEKKDVWITVYALSERYISRADSIISTVQIKQ